MNEYEIEHTARFEGVYTEEEIILNNKLYAECSKETLDCSEIERLLRSGADPLGATAVSGWGLLEHIYGELICSMDDSTISNLPRITELFLKHGMDIDHPRVPYDDDNSLNPMWDFAFWANEHSASALEMLLNSGLSPESAGAMWGHAVDDLLMLGDCDLRDEFWKDTCVWVIKLIMLCASYDHVLADEDLRDFIGCSYNDYDLHKFRNWNNFDYEFDTSRCEPVPEFRKSVVHILEAASHQEIWKIGICLSSGEF